MSNNEDLSQVSNNQHEQAPAPVVLVVEDDRTNMMMLEAKLSAQGYQVLQAEDGTSGKEQIKKHHQDIDVILLDRMMPDMDGIEVAKWLQTRQDLNQPPIIMNTAADQPDQIKEGIDVGVFYYLTKPVQDDVLRSVVNSAVNEAKQKRALRFEMDHHRNSFKLIKNCTFEIKNLDEAEDFACFISNSFPDPLKVMPGISALIVNAIEHGKCGIAYEEKGRLIDKGIWREEVNRRCNLKEIKDKAVEVVFTNDDDSYSLKITDSGEGFVWHKYLRVDPARALHNHGRGIARANMLFDRIDFNEAGNEVIASIMANNENALSW